MGTNNMLQKILAYEKSLLTTYTKFAKIAENTEEGLLFIQFAENAKERINHLEKLLEKYCKG